MPRCCYCDASVRPRFDYCSACNARYTAQFGPDWTSLDWHQATIGISRRERYAERREAPFATVRAAALERATPVLPPPPAPLDDLIMSMLAAAPGAGWRTIHRRITAQGLDVTASTVKSRLCVLRRRAGGN